MPARPWSDGGAGYVGLVTAEPGAAPAGQPGGQRPEIRYEDARDQLTEVVRRLESGGLSLEESLALWERGKRLAAICEQWLEGARARLAAAIGEPENGDGESPPAPF